MATIITVSRSAVYKQYMCVAGRNIIDREHEGAECWCGQTEVTLKGSELWCGHAEVTLKGLNYDVVMQK